MNVFISHALADRNAAENIASALKAQGLAVTNPVANVAPGENIALRVGKALEQANAIIVLLSPEAVKSEWVQNEIGYALTSPRIGGRVVPVMVRKTDDVPWILEELNIIERQSSFAALSRKILKQIEPAGAKQRRQDLKLALARA